MPVAYPTFTAAREALLAGRTTARDLVSAHLTEIDERADLNALLLRLDESATAQATDIDRRLAAGEPVGPLAGMILALKDNMASRGDRTTCGSKMLENFVSVYDATVVERLRAADAVLIGKANMDEFAMGSSNENSAFGPAKHPLDPSRVPGGSSGGSAVAVAAHMAHTSLGSDTGGSIRTPAAFCGVVGLKPTYGRVSRYGLVAFASSFDQIGPFAHTARDAAAVLQVIAGADPMDATCAALPVPDYAAALTGDVRGLRVAVPKEYRPAGLNPAIDRALEQTLDRLRERGAVIVENLSLPNTEHSIATYYILTMAEASSNLARFDGVRYGHRTADQVERLGDLYIRSRTEGFGPEVKRRIMLGTYVLSAGYYDAYYRKAQQVRRLIRDDFDRIFEQADVLLTPTVPSTAFKLGEKTDDPLEMYLSDIYTTSANLAGIPGLSFPVGSDDGGLPIGLQLLGRPFDEATLLRVADALEMAS